MPASKREMRGALTPHFETRVAWVPAGLPGSELATCQFPSHVEKLRFGVSVIRSDHRSVGLHMGFRIKIKHRITVFCSTGPNCPAGGVDTRGNAVGGSRSSSL